MVSVGGEGLGEVGGVGGRGGGFGRRRSRFRRARRRRDARRRAATFPRRADGGKGLLPSVAWATSVVDGGVGEVVGALVGGEGGEGFLVVGEEEIEVAVALVSAACSLSRG